MLSDVDSNMFAFKERLRAETTCGTIDPVDVGINDVMGNGQHQGWARNTLHAMFTDMMASLGESGICLSAYQPSFTPTKFAHESGIQLLRNCIT
jgi:hypothetical protein